MGETWHPASWQQKEVAQQATYPDPEATADVVKTISRLPPLVTSWEVERLRGQLADAAEGKSFLLQGGDCAESFDDCSPDAIASKLKILLQMSVVLSHGARKRVIRVGRMAGQYAKPRSADLESRGDVTLPAYRGDLVNRSGFTTEERTPDPHLMLRGYERAALTLNFTRALTGAGFADLHHPEYWDLSFFEHSQHAAEFQRIADSIRESLDFIEAVTGQAIAGMNHVSFYASHEGLALLYEQAQTRTVPRHSGWYNLSTHMPWMGMRTANLDGAHVEYFRGIRNPMGLKVGPGMTAEWLMELLRVLNPDNEPGRITLIHRMGANAIADKLPPLIDAVARSGRRVLWCSDPMHGNTEKTSNGYKTRRFDNILRELEQALDVHSAAGTILGGVHFEMTGEDVTECIGGARGLAEEDLQRAYRSAVDPRLNYEQAMEVAFSLARRLKRGSRVR